jgi:hypothetical protein
VIDWYKKKEKLLNCLLIFLLPTQLALHFWPPSAFVFGIRVDYLSPSIYLTDALFITLFVLWAVRERRIFLAWLKNNRFYIAIFLALAILNICFSVSLIPSLYKWIKIVEMALLSYYVWARRDVFESDGIFTSLYLALIFFSLIGIAQFIKGGTLGGIMYFLGERTYNLSTPGIALVSLAGEKFLRAYSTLPHPNALAGFLGAGTLILIGPYFKKIRSKKNIGIGIILVCFILTFSLSAFVAILFCTGLYLLIRKKIFTKNHIPLIVLVFLLVSLLLPAISKDLLGSGISFGDTIGQRLELALVSGKIISGKFWIGTGANTFIIQEAKTTVVNSPLWLLQPVHNIYLLVMSEVGIAGILFLYFLLAKILKEAFTRRAGIFLALVFILTSGLFDHYWFTLQQNMLLAALIFGNSFRAKS